MHANCRALAFDRFICEISVRASWNLGHVARRNFENKTHPLFRGRGQVGPTTSMIEKSHDSTECDYNKCVALQIGKYRLFIHIFKI